MDTKTIFETAKKNGFVKLESGIWLCSGKFLKEEFQDYDPKTIIDFKAAPYWLSTGNGTFVEIEKPEDMGLKS